MSTQAIKNIMILLFVLALMYGVGKYGEIA